MSNIIKVNGGNGSGRVIKLITKSVSANGTYQASSDNADGYSEVRVNTGPSTTPMIFSDGGQQVVLSSILGNLDYTYKFQLYISNYQTETLIFGSDWNIGCKLFHTYGSLAAPTLYYYTNNTPLSIPSTLNKILDVETSTDYIKIDGTTYSGTATARASSAISLFGFSTTHRSSVGIGEFKVYDNSDDSIVMDLVPMKDDVTGEGYFYDTVGEQSYYSNTAYPLHYLAITETDDPITLIDKSITANGTYSAPDDNADGYSSVTVNVSHAVTVESDDTPVSTSSATATVEEGGIYLFSTVYNGRDFSDVKILTGDNTAAYTKSGLGRMWTVVKALTTTASYNWYGDICPNLYNKIEFEENGINIDEDVTMANYVMTVSNPFTSSIGELFIVGTDENSFSGTFTGADVICHNLLGSTDSNRTAFFIVRATAQSIIYSGTISYITRLVAGKDISKIV